MSNDTTLNNAGNEIVGPMDNLPREDNREAGPIASMTTIRQILHENAVEISFDQVTAIFEKHQLGAVQSFNLLQSGPMNSVFSVTNQHCEAFILKVQYRRGIGSLQADHYVTNLLSESTSLPVSSLCLLDISGDIIVHPYLAYLPHNTGVKNGISVSISKEARNSGTDRVRRPRAV